MRKFEKFYLVKYPIGETMYDGSLVDNRDIAKEVCEKLHNGISVDCPDFLDVTEYEREVGQIEETQQVKIVKER